MTYSRRPVSPAILEVTGAPAPEGRQVTVRGEITYTTLQQWRTRLHEEIDAMPTDGVGTTLCLDLREVTHLDSSGLLSLVHARMLLEKQRNHLILMVRQPSQPARTLQRDGLDAIIPLHFFPPDSLETLEP